MRSDARLSQMHALAQGLLTTHMEGRRRPLVVQSIDPHVVVGTLRTVAAAADYSLRGYPRLPDAASAPALPPRHVVVRQGAVTKAVAADVVALCGAMPDDAIVALLVPPGDRGTMDNLGEALLAAGMIDHDGDDELEPGQRVPTIRLD